MNKELVGELVMRCFHARTNAHILHLKTKSYAVHKALNDFYDEIVDLVDALVENFQGIYGLIENYPSDFELVDDPRTLVAELGSWIEASRGKLFSSDDTALYNQLDEILALCGSTTYKLRFLK